MNTYHIKNHLIDSGINPTSAERLATQANSLMDELRQKGHVVNYNKDLLIAKTERCDLDTMQVQQGVVIIGKQIRHIPNI